MKLDATDLRYVTSDEFRVLTAVEMGSKNHEVVPTTLITRISGLRHGGVNKLIGSLAKRNLVSKVQNSKYDGYRLTYGGYDYLGMRAMSKRNTMTSVGNQIGVGKESDIYIVSNADGNEMVLKLHRLGRVSFRAIKQKRDYLGKRKSASWLYMSRLAAQKEWAFMKILYENGFPVPKPIDQARHCILMEFIDAYPLRQVSELPSPGKLYSALMDVIVRLAHAGLIHGDFNEFNILIRRDTGEPVIIDFPQMVSTSHENAEWYFNRDVECIRTFFKRRFGYESSLYPRFKSVKPSDESQEQGRFRLDVAVAASGFARKDMTVLEEYMETIRKSEGHEELGQDEEPNENEEYSEEEEDIDENNTPTDHEETLSERDYEEPVSGLRGRDADDCSPPRECSDDCEQETHGSSEISPHRSLSRSPPRSRSLSPDSIKKLTDATAALSLQGIKDIVSSDLSTTRARQQRKYHSRRGIRRAGRPQGSKAKQDNRVRLSKLNGFWE